MEIKAVMGAYHWVSERVSIDNIVEESCFPPVKTFAGGGKGLAPALANVLVFSSLLSISLHFSPRHLDLRRCVNGLYDCNHLV